MALDRITDRLPLLGRAIDDRSMLRHRLQQRRRHFTGENGTEMRTAQRLGTWPGGDDPDVLRVVAKPDSGRTQPIEFGFCRSEATADVQLEQQLIPMMT